MFLYISPIPMPTISAFSIIPGLYNLQYIGSASKFEQDNELTHLPFVDAGFVNGLGLSTGLFPWLPDGSLDLTSHPSWWTALKWSTSEEERVCDVFNKCTHLQNVAASGTGGHKALVDIGKFIKEDSKTFKLISSWTNAFWNTAQLNERVET